MSDCYFTKYCETLSGLNRAVEITCGDGRRIEPNTAFEQLCTLTRATQDAGGKLCFVGNGASATMASHFALDFSKNGKCPALAFNDIAFLTAIGNDLGYDQVFAMPLRSFLNPHDILITISSSGQSPNILSAIQVAKTKNSRIVTYSGLIENNASRVSGDINFYLPARTYGMVESGHHILLHAWLDKLVGDKEWE